MFLCEWGQNEIWILDKKNNTHMCDILCNINKYIREKKIELLKYQAKMNVIFFGNETISEFKVCGMIFSVIFKKKKQIKTWGKSEEKKENSDSTLMGKKVPSM